MSAMSRTKGKAGEREAAAVLHSLTGHTVRRRVRQDGGDSDLIGIPGWSVEVKRHASATVADVDRWYAQAVAQALRENLLPLLIYRADRQEWRCRWPLSAVLLRSAGWAAPQWSADTTPDAWATVYRETQGKTFGELLEAF